MFDTQPGTNIKSRGPLPMTWYAMLMSPFLAYRICGVTRPPLFVRCNAQGSTTSTSPEQPDLLLNDLPHVRSESQAAIGIGIQFAIGIMRLPVIDTSRAAIVPPNVRVQARAASGASPATRCWAAW